MALLKRALLLATLLTFAYLPTAVHAGIFDYFIPTRNPTTALDDSALPTVPYELAATDEQFIRDGAQLIGVGQLSGLDMCHQRVVLVLRKSCADLSAEQLGKLAVMLLNCQSDSEKRPLFACTDAMSLQQCTEPMDANTWNAYHLVTNRAKAVCTTVRHDQFRGLTEMTVNRLMEAARDQVQLMQSVTSGQERLHEATQRSLDALGDNNGRLIDQQQEMLRVSEEHRAAIETSLQDLMHEKSLIRAGQLEVAEMITKLKAKVDDGLITLDSHSRQTHTNHAQLLHDLDRLQQNAARLSDRLEQTMEHMLAQSEMAAVQFDTTVGRLGDIRRTVSDVAQLMGDLQADLQRHLAWLAERVGGTDRMVLRLQLVLQYVAFVLFGMLMLVFVGAGAFSRWAFVVGAAGGFAVNYTEVGQVELRDVTLGILAVILVNFIRRHIRLPASMSLHMQSKDIPTDQLDATVTLDTTAQAEPTTTTTKQTLPNGRDYDTDYSHRVRYQSRQTPAYDYKTPATSRDERSRTPSLLNGDARRYERDSTSTTSSNVSRVGTPFSVTSESMRTRCVAITQKGDRCRLAAQLDGERCVTHSRMLER